MRKSLIFGMVISASFLILFWGFIAYSLSGCTIRAFSDGSDYSYDHQDYILGVRKTETED